jgi:hypothetical protein
MNIESKEARIPKYHTYESKPAVTNLKMEKNFKLFVSEDQPNF